MGDTVLFSPNTKDAAGNAVNPSFVGGGSIIKQPDIFPIFPGVGWPGTGDISVAKIMSAVNSLVAGPYLDGLKQYGYIGPAQVRDPRIDTQPYQAGLSPLVPGVNQAANYSGAINGYITGLLQNDEIPNVDDNHDLIVMVFLDQNNQFPEKMDAKGNITPSFSGANEAIEYFELLDDNTRFEGAWIITSGRSLAQVMQTFAHELVEAITDPFNSGWRQTNPPPTSGQDQLADVCNQAGTVGGVPVVAYWSDADLACIIPAQVSTRSIWLTENLVSSSPFDGPAKVGFVDLGTFCARGFFDYVERTYANHIVVTAEFEGYEQPLVVWTINGGPVPLGGGTIEVAATWELQPPTLPASNKSPTQGSVDGTSPKPPIALLNVGFNGWSANSSKLDIFVGPGQGNAVLTVTAQVSELFDDPSVGGRGHTIRKAISPVDHKNEEIAWGDAYNQAKQQCDDIHRLGRDLSGALGVPKPGDPPDLVTLITRAIRDQSARRKNLLLEAANHVTASRPELADLLIGLAQRTN